MMLSWATERGRKRGGRETDNEEITSQQEIYRFIKSHQENVRPSITDVR